MSVADIWDTGELQKLVTIDPELLGAGTDADYRFYYVDVSSVSEGKIDLPPVTIAFRGSPSRARKVVRRGDVLMATVRPNLKAFAYFDREIDDCVASTGFAVLRAKKGVDPRFVLYSILSEPVTRQIDALIVGSNYPAITTTSVSRLTILTPPTAEQSKIAEVLSTVDRAIAQTEALIAKQQRIKTGLMQDLLTRGIDEHGQLRSEATHAFKDSPLGRIPVEWEVDVGSKYFSLHAGIPTSAIDWNSDGNALYLKVDDFNAVQNMDGIIWAENCFNCPVNLQGHMLGPGTLVFPKRGAAIFINRVEILRKQATLDPNLMGLKVKQNVVATFLQLVLLHRDLGTICDNSGIPQINNKHLYPMQFAMPNQQEQEEIVRRSRQTELSVLLASERLRKLRHLKTALMQDLLTGKVRVTPLLEPAKEATA